MRIGVLQRVFFALVLACLMLVLWPASALPPASTDIIKEPIDPSIFLNTTPSGLVTFLLPDYGVTLRWKDNSSLETSYLIQRKKGTGGTWDNIGYANAVAGTGENGTYSDRSLVPGFTYFYRVYASYKDSYTPKYSNEAEIQVPVGSVPAAPANLRVVSQTGDQVVIAWDAPAVKNVTDYVLQYGDFDGDYVSTTLTASFETHTLASLKEQHFFHVRLRARNWYYGMSAYSNEVYAHTLPNAPGNLICAAQSDGVLVTWADNSQVENWYVIHRKDAANPWKEIVSIVKNSVSFKDATAVDGTVYTYRMKAVSTLGYSSNWSGEFTVTAGEVLEPSTTPEPSATPDPSATPGPSATPDPSTPAILPATATANPNKSTVLVNGEPVSFEAYTIGGYNYFKLRDLALALLGSAKQFEVTWNAPLKRVDLFSGLPYTVVGGEFALSGITTPIAANRTASVITLDGVPVSLGAYIIRGNNYFKLRDVGQALQFGVEWDPEDRIIKIDTSHGYIP